MEIAELTSGHVEAGVAVAASLPAWFGWPGALDAIAEALRSQRGLVALDDGRVVAFVTFAPIFEETMEITYLAVDAAFRRRGIGGRLIRAVRSAAATYGATTISLLTLGPSAQSEAYAETVAFYRALGFVRTKEVEIVSWGGAPALVMAARLSEIV